MDHRPISSPIATPALRRSARYTFRIAHYRHTPELHPIGPEIAMASASAKMDCRPTSMKLLSLLCLTLLTLASATLLTGCESTHRPRSDYDEHGHRRAGWNHDRPGWGQDRRESRGGFQRSWYSPAHL